MGEWAPAAMELRSYAINPPSTYMMRNARSVALSSTYAFVAGYSRDSLAVVDVADSIAPNATWRIQSSSRLDGVLELFLSGDLLYALSPLDNMLTVLDVSSPTSPSVLEYLQSEHFSGAQGMAVAVRPTTEWWHRSAVAGTQRRRSFHR